MSMGDSHSRKPGSGPGGTTPPASSPAAGEKPVAPADEFVGRSGRIVHDERGNAVWDWIKETSRIAIDSTSRLLKRLEVPELKVEDTQTNNELSLESDRDAGGGYNPYGGSTSGGKSAGPRSGGAGSRGPAPGSAESRGAAGAGSTRGAPANARGSGNSGASNLGGGYDPYGKGVTRKPGR
jgi:hypothetical protein